jgi:hypothetical protein
MREKNLSIKVTEKWNTFYTKFTLSSNLCGFWGNKIKVSERARVATMCTHFSISFSVMASRSFHCLVQNEGKRVVFECFVASFVSATSAPLRACITIYTVRDTILYASYRLSWCAGSRRVLSPSADHFRLHNTFSHLTRDNLQLQNIVLKLLTSAVCCRCEFVALRLCLLISQLTQIITRHLIRQEKAIVIVCTPTYVGAGIAQSV